MRNSESSSMLNLLEQIEKKKHLDTVGGWWWCDGDSLSGSVNGNHIAKCKVKAKQKQVTSL